MNRTNYNNRDYFEIYAKTISIQNLKHKHIKPHKNKLLIFISIFLCILIFLIVSSLIGFNYFFNSINTNFNFQKSCQTLGVASMEKIHKKVINIALFGVDKRKGEHFGRSDANLILTLDEKNSKIKLTTILRDSRVKIEGHGMEKICHAFSYGGPNLAVKTINQNFKLDIHDYIKVDFSQMAEIVDALGGLDVKISKSEGFEINGLMNSTFEFVKLPRVKPLTQKIQQVHLTGAQVLNYTRIRNIDSDIKRADRQQYVLELIFEKLKTMKKTQYPSFIKKILKIIETSLTSADVLNFVPMILGFNGSIEKNKIPDPNNSTVKNGIIDGSWVWNFDIKEYTKKLHKFIYDDVDK